MKKYITFTFLLVIGLVFSTHSQEKSENRPEDLKALYDSLLIDSSNIDLKKSYFDLFPKSFKTLQTIYDNDSVLSEHYYEHMSLFFSILKDRSIFKSEEALDVLLTIAQTFERSYDNLGMFYGLSIHYLYNNVEDKDYSKLKTEEKKIVINYCLLKPGSTKKYLEHLNDMKSFKSLNSELNSAIKEAEKAQRGVH